MIQVLRWANLFSAMVIVISPAQIMAQSYPNKPVRVIVPLAPGGATDIQARLFTQKLSVSLGQTFLVDNRAGAGGLIAFNLIAHQSAPDGYTLLATSPGFTNVPALYDTPPFDPIKDFEPIILMSKAPYALVVTPSFPAKSIVEFIAWCRANPGKLNFGVSGMGTTVHFAAVWLGDGGNIKMTNVPYKGTGPVLQDLIAGQVHVGFANVISATPLIKSGKIRALAVTTAQRSSVYPDLPTLAESGIPDFDVTTWHGWLGPRGTPRPVISVMNTELAKVLKFPDVIKMMADDGGVPIGGTPDDFRKHIVTEIDRWKKLVRENGIKPET